LGGLNGDIITQHNDDDDDDRERRNSQALGFEAACSQKIKGWGWGWGGGVTDEDIWRRVKSLSNRAVQKQGT